MIYKIQASSCASPLPSHAHEKTPLFASKLFFSFVFFFFIFLCLFFSYPVRHAYGYKVCHQLFEIDKSVFETIRNQQNPQTIFYFSLYLWWFLRN